MHTFTRLLFFIGYVFSVGPPRAMDLQLSEDKTGGELANQPIGILLTLELGLRLILLMCCVVAVEELIGKGLYESLHLDTFSFILGLSGISHTLAYYIFLVLPKNRNRQCFEKLYRFVRNLSYSPLPGFAVVAVVLVWEQEQGFDFFETSLPFYFYGVTTLTMLAASVIETFLSKRTPLGLDESYKPD